MFELQAPWPAYVKNIKLPSPNLADSVRPTSTVTVQRAMTNAVTTYVRRNGTLKNFGFSFTLTREKSLQLFDFIELYSGEVFRLIWQTRDTLVVLKTNPLDLEISGRALIGNNVEEVNVQLEFQEI